MKNKFLKIVRWIIPFGIIENYARNRRDGEIYIRQGWHYTHYLWADITIMFRRNQTEEK